MTITVNGKPVELSTPTTLAELAELHEKRSIAIAVNGSVVPASAHATTYVNDGDAVEIVTAVAGG